MGGGKRSGRDTDSEGKTDSQKDLREGRQPQKETFCERRFLWMGWVVGAGWDGEEGRLRVWRL